MNSWFTIISETRLGFTGGRTPSTNEREIGFVSQLYMYGCFSMILWLSRGWYFDAINARSLIFILRTLQYDVACILWLSILA